MDLKLFWGLVTRSFGMESKSTLFVDTDLKSKWSSKHVQKVPINQNCLKTPVFGEPIKLFLFSGVAFLNQRGNSTFLFATSSRLEVPVWTVTCWRASRYFGVSLSDVRLEDFAEKQRAQRSAGRTLSSQRICVSTSLKNPTHSFRHRWQNPTFAHELAVAYQENKPLVSQSAFLLGS